MSFTRSVSSDFLSRSSSLSSLIMGEEMESVKKWERNARRNYRIMRICGCVSTILEIVELNSPFRLFYWTLSHRKWPVHYQFKIISSAKQTQNVWDIKNEMRMQFIPSLCLFSLNTFTSLIATLEYTRLWCCPDMILRRSSHYQCFALIWNVVRQTFYHPYHLYDSNFWMTVSCRNLSLRHLQNLIIPVWFLNPKHLLRKLS